MTEGRPKAAPDSDSGVALGVGESGASSRAHWSFEPGRVVAGKYRVDSVLGRGGMGVVVAGVQLDLERPVAIKFLRPNLAQNARPTQRFAREGRAIAKMRSEHVVRVFDVGDEEGVPFIVMEHLHGHDLASELRQGPLSVALTLEYVLQACEAIAEAHSLGIVHRDLKPSNLFLAEGFAGRRTLKVLDFGVSKWLGPLPDLDTPLSTSEGSFIGTPAYVSPEQLTRPESVDQRTDVWALGVVLYQCLSARLPFEGDSVPRLCAEVLTAEPRALPASLALPDGLNQVILRCLRKDLGQRYASILELAEALSPFSSTSPGHLLASIRSLSNGASDGGRRPSLVSAPTPSDASAPQTTLIFSHEAAPSNTNPSGLSATTRRVRLRAVLLPIAAALLLVWAVLAQRAERAPQPSGESEPVRSGTPRTETAVPAPPPSGVSAPLAAATPAASTRSEEALPRAAARPVKPSSAGSARKPAARASSATPRAPVAAVSASSLTDAKPAEPVAVPSARPSNPDTIDPAQLYRR